MKKVNHCPKINFINHASYIVQHNDISFLVDPWIEGKVFDDSWDLIAKTKFEYKDFSKVNHIWFSHEHPDHFSLTNLKNIELEFRKRINIFYQKTKDKKVKSFCEKLNF